MLTTSFSSFQFEFIAPSAHKSRAISEVYTQIFSSSVLSLSFYRWNKSEVNFPVCAILEGRAIKLRMLLSKCSYVIAQASRLTINSNRHVKVSDLNRDDFKENFQGRFILTRL